MVGIYYEDFDDKKEDDGDVVHTNNNNSGTEGVNLYSWNIL